MEGWRDERKVEKEREIDGDEEKESGMKRCEGAKEGRVKGSTGEREKDGGRKRERAMEAGKERERDEEREREGRSDEVNGGMKRQRDRWKRKRTIEG